MCINCINYVTANNQSQLINCFNASIYKSIYIPEKELPAARDGQA